MAHALSTESGSDLIASKTPRTSAWQSKIVDRCGTTGWRSDRCMVYPRRAVTHIVDCRGVCSPLQNAGFEGAQSAMLENRLRDRGLESLGKRMVIPAPASKPAPRDQTVHSRSFKWIIPLVDIMVVDEIHRQSMGRPWVTVAFDIATRAVLGFVLSLNPPSAVSVGLALAMSALPKDDWLKERDLDLQWPMHGLPKILHLDNGDRVS